jgi:uncharacterized protein (TIGR00369 family)
MSNVSPPARRSAEEQARLDAALKDLFQHRITFNEVLGLEVETAHPAPPRLRFAMRPQLVGSAVHGRLHGGVTAAVLDAMGGLALMAAIGERHGDESTANVLKRFLHMATIDLRVDYLRPGVGSHFVASATVLRLGQRIGSTQMRLVNESDRLIATAAGTYAVS